MIILFVLPVALVALAVVCFGRCMCDMLDERDYSPHSIERPPTS